MLRLFLVIVLLLPSIAYGKFDDLPVKDRIIDIDLSADSRDKQIDVLGMIPIYNGYVGASISQSFQSGVIDSQTIVVRGQNGIRYKGLGLEGFAEYNADQVAGVNTSEVGGFVRPGIFNVLGATFSSGFGTFLENQAVRDDLGLTDADPVTAPRLLGFVSGKYAGIPNTTLTALFKITPSYAFDEAKYSVDATVLYDLGESVSIGNAFHWERDSDPLVESAGSNYQLSLNLRIKL